jgi:endonuclease YncB( thermonuclease family)
VAASRITLGRVLDIDGETFEIHGTRFRMHGIDAPESRQECIRADGPSWRCGQQAALALSDYVGRATVRCEPGDHDRHGRVVAACFRGTGDLDRWMVANGWAAANRRDSLDAVADEERATSDKLGIWSGSFEMPRDWRTRGSVA